MVKVYKFRHNKDVAKRGDITTYQGEAYLGIDAGSTTIKTVVIGSDNEILDELYQSNSGDPIPIIKEHLIHLYEQYPIFKLNAAL